MKRRIVIQFIVTAQEKRAMQRAAKRRGQSLSSFIRNVTLYPHLASGMAPIVTFVGIPAKNVVRHGDQIACEMPRIKARKP